MTGTSWKTTAKISTRLEQLDPPRLEVADLGERGHASCPDWLGPVGGIGSGAEGGISAAAAGGLGGAAARGRRRGPPTRSISTSRLGQHVGGVLLRAVGEEDRAARDRRRAGARRRARACRWSRPRRGRRRRRRGAWRRRATARRPAAGAGSAAPARRRPPSSSTASGRCRAAARPWRRAALRGAFSVTGSHAGTSKLRGRLALLPAHALAADLVERQPGVERDRLEQPPRRDRPGGDARAGARRARRRRR